MGNWNINIQGVGSHHNNAPEDADKLAAKLVEELRLRGHYVSHATFTYGAATELPKS